MFNDNDLNLINDFGIAINTIEQQIEIFRKGIPFLNIDRVASIGDGIVSLSAEEKSKYVAVWQDYMLAMSRNVVKFVPASGAASRMFKDLYDFAENGTKTVSVGKFFEQIEHFAFYNILDEKCTQAEKKGIEQLMLEGKFECVTKILLHQHGLNYGNLPKGLLLFHKYINENRTPFLEHLAESVEYLKSADGIVRLHFTVSPEHKELFVKHLSQNLNIYESRYAVKFEISFSEQKKSTSTIAVDRDNRPLRDENNTILLRPAGHGALIENLNEIDADIIFIKNIDNIVPDRLKEDTIIYKKIIGGMLISLQRQTFNYLKELENLDISDAKLQIISQFCEKRLFNFNKKASTLGRNELIDYLKTKLNRPIRICGMVRNESEPGGGPYLVYNTDGTISPQILEGSQIDLASPSQQSLIQKATHFNPVDLVCGIKDHNGASFDLTRFIDHNTGFISTKSKNGKDLKALECPGLWNGAMSDWNTIFVEVPITTFNPVKSINDLLRDQHQ